MNKLALSAIILNLFDFVIRKFDMLDSPRDLWNKLIELYAEISLPSKLFLF